MHKGELLAELDPTFVAGDDKSSTDQAASLRAEVGRLRAELDGKPYVPDTGAYGAMQAANYQSRKDTLQSHMQNYAEKIASLKAKVDQAQAAATNSRERLVGLRDVEARRRELERLQVGSHLNTLAAIDARQQMEGQAADAENAARGAQQDLAAMISEAQNFAAAMAQRHLPAAIDAGAAARRHGRPGVEEQPAPPAGATRAAEDSIVLSVARVSVGSVMQGGDQFLQLVPIDAPLDIDASIPATQAGFVHVGDKVVIKFETLPYHNTAMRTAWWKR